MENNKIKQDDRHPLDAPVTSLNLNVKFTDSKHIIIWGLVIIALFFGFGGVWITFAEITGAIITHGEVRVDTERKTVAHLEGGIVNTIFVRNGDNVAKGQPLLTLESAKVVASTDQILLRLSAAKIEEARLSAEQNFASKPKWPEPLPEVDSDKMTELRSSARTVFISNQKALNNQIALLSKQIDQLLIQIKSIEEQIKEEKIISRTLKEELDAKQKLYDLDFIDKIQIMQLERSLSERRGYLAQFEGKKAEIRERIAEFKLRTETLRSEYRKSATTDLAETRKLINDLQQQLLPLKDARRRLEVTAPVSGEIVAMRIQSPGGVVKPGEAILDIVPDDTMLIVESLIQVKDIANIHLGQKADVQLLAFPKRTTPKIKAEVIYISADRLLKQTLYGEQPSYIIHVKLDKKDLENNELYLSAGMPAAVFINTEPRTVLEYALEPLLENFERALRES